MSERNSPPTGGIYTLIIVVFQFLFIAILLAIFQTENTTYILTIIGFIIQNTLFYLSNKKGKVIIQRIAQHGTDLKDRTIKQGQTFMEKIGNFVIPTLNWKQSFVQSEVVWIPIIAVFTARLISAPLGGSNTTVSDIQSAYVLLMIYGLYGIILGLRHNFLLSPWKIVISQLLGYLGVFLLMILINREYMGLEAFRDRNQDYGVVIPEHLEIVMLAAITSFSIVLFAIYTWVASLLGLALRNLNSFKRKV